MKVDLPHLEACFALLICTSSCCCHHIVATQWQRHCMFTSSQPQPGSNLYSLCGMLHAMIATEHASCRCQFNSTECQTGSCGGASEARLAVCLMLFVVQCTYHAVCCTVYIKLTCGRSAKNVCIMACACAQQHVTCLSSAHGLGLGLGMLGM